jgi:hypothetical protein
MSRLHAVNRSFPAAAPLRPAASKQHGAASLIVVMVLFFILSLTAAYTSRNLIFEQRTSVNQYRSTQAFEAAEAGVQWALAQLNGGRIGSDCQEAGAGAADTSFRQRYLSIDTNAGAATAGMITPRKQADGVTALRPGCVWNGAVWQCNCPGNAAPALAAPAGAGSYPAFRVRFTINGITQPGVVRIESSGCTSLNENCLEADAATVNVEGNARVTTLVALKPAIAAQPAAALTVLGDIAGGGDLHADAGEQGAYALRAGGAIHNAGTFTLAPAGTTPATLRLANDTALALPQIPPLPAAAVVAHAERAFSAAFGAWPNSVRQQPGVVLLNCPAAGCRQALTDAVAANPDRVIWVAGDLTLESAGDIGSPPNPADPTVAGPATIIVNGGVNFAMAGVRIFGFLYTRGANAGAWTGNGVIDGAAFVEGDLAATAAPRIAYDSDVLDTLLLRGGSFVPIPGGWRDMP